MHPYFLASLKRLTERKAFTYMAILCACFFSYTFPLTSLAQNPAPLKDTSDSVSSLRKVNELRERAEQLNSKGRFKESLLLSEEALKIQKQVLGHENYDVLKSIVGLGRNYEWVGSYGEAQALYEQALEGYRNLLIKLDPDGSIIESVAEENIQLLSSDSPIHQEKPKDPSTKNREYFTKARDELISLCLELGKYDEAESLYKQLIEIYIRRNGRGNLIASEILNELSDLYIKQKKYNQAKEFLSYAVDLYKPFVDTQDSHQLRQSIAKYQQFLDGKDVDKLDGNSIRELSQILSQVAVNDGKITFLAEMFNRLANLSVEQGDFNAAEKYLREALNLYSNHLIKNTSTTFGIFENLIGLAFLYKTQKNYQKAEIQYKKALVFLQSIPNNNAIQNWNTTNKYLTAIITFDLAKLYEMQARYSEFRGLLKKSIKLLIEAKLGFSQTAQFNHPFVATPQYGFALNYMTLGDSKKAEKYLKQGLEIEEDDIRKNVTFGSENQKLEYTNIFSGSTNFAISLHLRANFHNLQFAHLALTTVLRRKGRALDALTSGVQNLREGMTLNEQRLLDKLIGARTQLATLYYQSLRNDFPQNYHEGIVALQNQANQLEADLSNRNTKFRSQFQPITIEAVQKKIERSVALVELVLYHPVDYKSLNAFDNRWFYSRSTGYLLGEYEKSRYAAYILHSQGEPQWVDLGEAEPIDQKVDQFRRLILSPNRVEQFQKTARELDALVMQPIRKHLGNTRKILLSPDGQLNLVPFAALIDEHNRYLVENYEINYLTSGRDLLRLPNQPPSREPPLIVANPDFDHPGSPSSVLLTYQSQPTVTTQDSSRSPDIRQRSRDLSTLKFGALPGTLEEAKAIKSKIPDATLLINGDATENALKQAKAPRILHIATHGFFLQDQPLPSFTEQNRGLSFLRADFASPADTALPRFTAPTANIENSLLRSGLALAGFNLRQSGNEDGVLTALEAAGLDLRGTQLVVLSACETGVGDIANGEGVYGLRRAFVIAGAASQLFSLWKVDDLGTKELMVKYYDRLLAHEGRSAALRNVQLELLQSKRYSHPFYWAAFIPSGDWRPLN